MADDDKGSSSWYKVPTWDGNPAGFRTFKREMEWWKASLDPASCAKFNIAARWTLRQSGLVRSRAEEFTPSELEGKPAVVSTDPESGEKVVIEPGDPFAGLDKLMKALEDSLGKTPLDRKGELRKQFYQDLRRMAGERISAFCSRFRTLVGEMRREGIHLPDEELGWFLRNRMGLDAIRVQLLDTALMGKEKYDEVESEALRLFRDLHVEDPLHKQRSDRAPVLQRFLSSTMPSTSASGFRSSYPTSSASSMASRSFKSSAPSVSQRFTPKARPPAPPPRVAMVAEGLDEDETYEPEEEELMPDETVPANLEEVLQSEAEVLAAEIEAMEEEGIDPSLIDGLERGIDQAAESLVTMREARNKINEIKKDRGYGKLPAGTKPKMHGNQVAAKKSKTFCWDCGQSGHWSGDDGCPNPGSGAFKPKAAAKKPVKNVRVAEALNTEHLLDEQPMSSAAEHHEVMMTQRLLCPSSLTEALARSNEVCQVAQRQLAEDKQLVGALDSACNRTCSGHMWMDQYLSMLSHAPQAIKNLVEKEPEEEVFRFGDGGVQVSTYRYRVPMMVGSDLVLTWVSVVPVPSLGLLLGRDWLDGIGCNLSFAKKVMRADHLSGKLIPLHQILAGHFALALLPSSWPSPGLPRWRRVGQDGVLELQISSRDWLQRKLTAESYVVRHGREHEHLVTEQSLKLGDVSFSGMLIEGGMAAPTGVMVQAMRSTDRAIPSTTSSRTTLTVDGASGSQRACISKLQQVAAHRGAHGRKNSMARGWFASLARAAALFALSAVALSFSGHSSAVGSPDGGDAQSRNSVPGGCEKGTAEPAYERRFPQGLHVASRPAWGEGGFLGGPHPSRSSGRPWNQGFEHKDQGGGHPRRAGKSKSLARKGGTPSGRSAPRWPQGRSTAASGRFGQACVSSSDRGGRERYRGHAQREASPFSESHFGRSSQPRRGNQLASGRSSSNCAHEASAAPSFSSRGAKLAERSRSHAPTTGSAGGGAHEALAAQYQSGVGVRRASPPPCTDPPQHGLRVGDGSGHGSLRLDSRRNFRDGGRAMSLLPDVQPLSESVRDNPWRIHQDLKRGQAMMIGQAWDKHCRDRELVSRSAQEVLATMHEEWKQKMQSCLNEAFVMQVSVAPGQERQLPQPLATECVCKQAHERGHLTGTSMSLSTGWNFLLPEHRKRCIRQVMEENPFCLVLAFPCGPWSAEPCRQGQVLLDFVFLLARIQVRNNNHFILEHPQDGMAWEQPNTMRFIEELQCASVDFDLCRFSLRSAQGGFYRKPSRILTSSDAVADELRNSKCLSPGNHAHQSGAGQSPMALARQLVDSLERQFEKQFRRVREVCAVDGVEEESAEMQPFESESDISSVDGEEGLDGEQPQLRVSSAVRNAVKRLHENTGHRSNRRLARALVIAGAPKEVVLAAKHLKCSICEKKRPKSRRPASLPSPKDVSDQVHVDVFEAKDINEERFYIIHAIDWMSRFQMAEALAGKSSEAIATWFLERWMPIFGPPRVLVADQGREFLSWEFQEMCDRHSILLHHIPVQAPWANGVCERGGGILKVLLECCVKSHSVVGLREMNMAVQESILAYNSDINEMGVSPFQAAVGRQPRMVGDTLGSMTQRLAEHGLIDGRPSLARQVALRETARLAMTRLHFSRSIRKGELGRSRSSTMTMPLEPGSIVYFWRESKYNSKTGPSKRKISLRRWHGPALLVALEGHSAGYVSFKGQLTKCAREHLRLASSMEQISAEVWKDAIQEAVVASLNDLNTPTQHREHSQPPTPSPPTPAPAVQDFGHDLEVSGALPLGAQPVDLPDVKPGDVAQALEPVAQQAATAASSRVPSTLPSRRPSNLSLTRFASGPVGGPGLSGEEESRQLSSRFQESLERAREADDVSRKRAASLEPELLRSVTQAASPQPEATPPPAGGPPEAMVSEAHAPKEVDYFNGTAHPLKLLYDQVQEDLKDPLLHDVVDHGTWSGRWPLPSRSNWQAHETSNALWPFGENEIYAAKTSRREIKWRDVPEHQKEEFRLAAETGWKVQTDNDAFQVVDEAEAKRIVARLKASNQMHKILVPRFVFTDKNDGVRSESKPMPLKANARLVIPGYQDETAYVLRKDAPTATRLSQHLLFTMAVVQNWHLWSADVKSAFLKGELFEEGERELYITNIRTQSADEPKLPLGPGNLARLRKGVFGLADSPRRWYLRLHRSLTQLGWQRSVMDAAMWTLRDSKGNLLGIVLSHVDDLLIAGSSEAHRSMVKLGEELGFGSFEQDRFQYCGKWIERHDDGSITVSMKTYHENLEPVSVPTHRKKDMNAPLTPLEHRQLRGILGSLQWLVTQVRVDMSFQLSTLQGEPATVQTLLKANALVRLFKQNPDFKLTFKGFDLRGAGITVVTDASLGNVTRSGGEDGTLQTKTFSQAAYLILIGDRALMSGKEGQCTFLDGRSHRLSRVCRSTYAAELQGAEEALDNGVFCRGLLAELLGYEVLTKHEEYSGDIPLNIVTDAKDVYDKGMSDTATYGSQKSLAFTIAWMREMFRKPRTTLSWTSTENMPCDCGTKAMDTSHLVKILNTGCWSVTYNPSFVKQNVKKKMPVRNRGPMLPGRLLTDEVLKGHLIKLSEMPGWHLREGVVIHVCRSAKSLRTPAPRFEEKAFPFRSSYGRFDSTLQSEWRVLDQDVRYEGKDLIGDCADVLITFFRPGLDPQKSGIS